MACKRGTKNSKLVRAHNFSVGYLKGGGVFVGIDRSSSISLRLILEKNLFGLEIDDRAAQLAAFALMMKARADDRSIFERGVQPHVLSIQSFRRA